MQVFLGSILNFARLHRRRETVGHVARLNAGVVVDTVALLCEAVLKTNLNAEIVRIAHVCCQCQVVQCRVGQRLHQCSVFVQGALAVGIGRSGIVLTNECARDGERCG